MTQEQYIQKANEKYNNFYDYTKTEYKGLHRPITIICPLHGEFKLIASSHLHKNCRCKECIKNDAYNTNANKIHNFIEESNKIHNNAYSYDKCVYLGGSKKTTITCKVHGDFQQTPIRHLKGIGCFKCAANKRGEANRITQEEFISKSHAIHHHKYDYSESIYESSSKKVKIKCKIHGIFEQLPSAHMHGQGCPKCRYLTIADKKRKLFDDIIVQFKNIHGDLYDYSKAEYRSSLDKICIICKKHGEFWKTPANHITLKQGCPKCSLEKNTKRFSYTFQDFLNKAHKKHGNKYDYSKSDFKNIHTEIEIICPFHGSIWQKPVNHYNKHGCPKCGDDARIAYNEKFTINDFLLRAKKAHGERYDYSKAEYKGNSTDIQIICKIHGSFWQLPANHTKGCNCPKCSNGQSKWETQIMDFIKSLDVDVKKTRDIISPYELDMYMEKYNFAVEANGLYYHSEKFVEDRYKHKNKTELCNMANVDLYQIFEDEWIEKQSIVESMIKNKLKMNPYKIYARKCTVREISYREAENFNTKNHLQGSSVSSYNLGLFDSDELISVMTFAKPRFNKNYEWELIRFCNKIDHTIIGGASKLFAFFIKNKNPKNIISYANKRFSNGRIYEILGFNNSLPDTEPNYFYIKHSKRFSRMKFQKHKLEKILSKYDPLLSERENMENNNYYRIWDCGNKVYTWVNKC